MTYHHLTEAQVHQLVGQGCTAADWRQVMISPACDLQRINDVRFFGTVHIGDTSGVHVIDGVELPCGIDHASIADCEIGDHVRIANIGSVVSNYNIEKDAVIQDIAALVAEPDASFGNGVELETINEAGGRGVRIINDLTSQVAYTQGMMRHNARFSKKLEELLEAKAKEAWLGKGRIAQGAKVLHCGTIKNVNLGPFAFVHGVQYLENGTINSCSEHPTEVGEGVQAKSFVLSEGARVESGVILDKVFVGQGVKMGKHYSAEDSLFFANSEAFHGEAVSLFAGPYTVTHHKSTLLIAGVYSFCNAGSGTNQSNHMYKLGAVHQGVLERGCKTGSLSYFLLEAHIGAFSVVIGKHYANIDTPNLPFSYIIEEAGASKIVPGINLASVGTVRDGEKWPKRDCRKAPRKRDLIIFDVFSPYTVEKMRRGRDELTDFDENTPIEKDWINYGGGRLSRPLLKKGLNYYSLAIIRYLQEKVMERACKALAKHEHWNAAVATLKPTSMLQKPGEWTDISGLLTPRERLSRLEERVAEGSIISYDSLLEEFRLMHEAYHEDEWQYVYETYAKEYGVQLDSVTKENLLAGADEWEHAAASLHGMVLEDSKKEFGSFARIGYGIDHDAENLQKDFEAVRGTIETNNMVQKLIAEAATIHQRKEQFRNLVLSMTT